LLSEVETNNGMDIEMQLVVERSRNEQ